MTCVAFLSQVCMRFFHWFSQPTAQRLIVTCENIHDRSQRGVCEWKANCDGAMHQCTFLTFVPFFANSPHDYELSLDIRVCMSWWGLTIHPKYNGDLAHSARNGKLPSIITLICTCACSLLTKADYQSFVTIPPPIVFCGQLDTCATPPNKRYALCKEEASDTCESTIAAQVRMRRDFWVRRLRTSLGEVNLLLCLVVVSCLEFWVLVFRLTHRTFIFCFW